MTVGFFFICSKKIGLGHFYRSFELHKQLSKKRSYCPFFFLSPYREVEKKLEAAHLPHFPLTKKPENVELDLAIVDCLHLPLSLARHIASFSKIQIHLDNPGKSAAFARLHICSLLCQWEKRIEKKGDHESYSGLPYLFLAPAFVKKRKKEPDREVKRIYVSFGGSDAKDLSLKYAPLFKKLPFEFLCLHPSLLPGKNMTPLSSLSSEELAQEMASCQLAITTLGLSFFECLCLGLPTLTLSVNAHQHRRGKEAQERGLTTYLGPAPVSFEKLKAGILSLAQNFEKRKSFFKKGEALVDGKGTERVLRLILNQWPTSP